MYKPANYYAARAAAVKNALEEERARYIADRQPVKPPRLYSLDDLLQCGERVSVTLGVFFGDHAGTVVDAIRCYNLPGRMYLAKYTDDDQTVHFIQVAAYEKQNDLYNYALSEIAVI